MDRIYLDNNATTQIDPQVADAILRTQLDLSGNPASQHWAGQRARRTLETARDQLAAGLGARTTGSGSDRLIFASGGTEANNLALQGIAGVEPGEVLVSAIEHPSVLETSRALTAKGHRVRELTVDSDGLVCRDSLRSQLSSKTRLVSIMLANNETGVLQPVASLAEICAEAGVPLHTDAVQAVGKIPVDFQELEVAAMSVSAHKFHGPVGTGALLVRSNVELLPTQFGGFQQAGLRAGTEAVAMAVGMARAFSLACDHFGLTLSRHRDALESGLLAGEPRVTIHGNEAERLPQTSCVSFPEVDRQELAVALDVAGIACATGSACASGSSEPSHVLQAMGVPEALIQSAIRFSLSRCTTGAEISQATSRILLVYSTLQQASESQKSRRQPRKWAPKSI